MRSFVAFALCAMLGMAVQAKDIVLDGVRYTLLSNNTVSAKAADKKQLVDVEIPATVRIGGIDYYVSEIERDGFSGCNNLKSIVLPNTLKRLKARAFKGCKNLEKVVMPDEAIAEVPKGEYGYGRDGIFKDCKSLSEARGHDMLYPQYIIFDAFYNCEETPFYQKVKEIGSAEMSKMIPAEPNPYATEEAKARQNISISYVYNGPATSEMEDAPLPSFAPDTVDYAVPMTGKVNPNTFAIVIGNENYKRIARVDYAVNDAQVFARYCNLTLGIPKSNIREYYNATLGDIHSVVNEVKEIATAYGGSARFIFYYAGHGLPDESTRDAYLLPVDAAGVSSEGGYPMAKLYEELSGLNAESVVAFIDACFSGSVRGEKMIASARGVKLRPKEIMPTGKLVVMSATQGDQTAFPYPEKNHGLFSYYLLKKLKDSSGDISLGDLADYLSREVAMQSVTVNRKLQTPSVNYSLGIHDTWREIKLK